jgi:hypothetical protein
MSVSSRRSARDRSRSDGFGVRRLAGEGAWSIAPPRSRRGTAVSGRTSRGWGQGRQEAIRPRRAGFRRTAGAVRLSMRTSVSIPTTIVAVMYIPKTQRDPLSPSRLPAPPAAAVRNRAAGPRQAATGPARLARRADDRAAKPLIVSLCDRRAVTCEIHLATMSARCETFVAHEVMSPGRPHVRSPRYKNCPGDDQATLAGQTCLSQPPYG